MAHHDDPATYSAAKRIDDFCDRFEQAWKARRQPRIEHFLTATAEADRPPLLAALLRVELELLTKAGEKPRLEDYQRRFAGHGGLVAGVFQQVLQTTSVRQRAAEETASYNPTTESVYKPPAAPSGPPSAPSATAETQVGSAAAVPATAPPVPSKRSHPKQFGRFQILDVLGEGGFGTVYRARDPQLDRDVALKIPRHGVLDSEEERERFLREGRTAATLTHPHICPVYEAGVLDGRHYIVMAYIEGKPLSKVIDGQRQIGERSAASTVRKLALALDEAHRKGVIHRDLKPANIMIDRRGQPVVMDFGLSRRHDPNESTLTRTGAVLGTPAYMAPEQALSQLEQVGPVTDVYALGIVLYEMLAGQRPFQGDAATVLGQVVHVQPKPPSALRAGLDPRLEAICLKAIAKNVADRFHSMREFAEALGEYLKTTEPATATSGAAPAAEAQELTSLVAGLQTQLSGIAQRQKVAWWKWAAASLATAVLVIAGVAAVIVATRPATGTVKLKLELDLSDTSLTFLLDGQDISAAELGATMELPVGDHELIVRRGNTLIKHLKFHVGEGDNAEVKPDDITPRPPAIVEAPAVDATPPPPVGHWTFDNPGPNAFASDIGGFKPGQSNGNVGWTTGVSGRAAAFEGANLQVVVPDDPKLHIRKALTIAAWVCPESPQPSRIVGKWYAKDSYNLTWGDGQFRFAVAFASADEWGTPVEIASWGLVGEWTHVAGVFDGQRVQLYLDGQLTNSQDLARSATLRQMEPFRSRGTPPNELQDSNSPLKIGSAFQGLIDDVQLWDTALNARQVATLAKGERPPPQFKQERDVAQWVLGLNGDVKIVAAGKETTIAAGGTLPAGDFRLVGINLDDRGAQITDADLERFSTLGRLRELGLRGTPTTDAGLVHLRDLTGLKLLNLHATRITSAGVKQLENLIGLEYLDLGYNQNITDAALPHLRKLKRLGGMNLWATAVQGTTFGALKDHEQLKFISLNTAQMTDEGMAQLALIRSLESLALQSNKFTDAGVAELAKLPKLWGVNLANNQITDAALVHLAKIKTLTRLTVSGTQATAEGIEKLKTALPEVQMNAAPEG
jgi:predicted Ser/Thr protein kinase